LINIVNQNQLKEFNEARRQSGDSLAFVPTMGALHDGHLSLVEEGFNQADQVIVSIFVNPTQFAPHEDLDKYPRTIEADMAKLEQRGVEAVWLPSVEDMYPHGQITDVHIDGITQPLEGEFRPGFFDGVTTVVKRLFDTVQPDKALFGEKDFQQLQVIKKMVRELSLPVEIIAVPIARDENGLALSSRNIYLSDDEYKIAMMLNKILQTLAQQDITEEQARNALIKAGFDKVDYCTCRNSDDFGIENPDRALAAVWLGQTRLIDNRSMAA
jgi:pantoate--beta-alanine ligase